MVHIGCPTCHTILNATAAGGCKDHWHEENKTSAELLDQFMRVNFPRAVAEQDGDAVMAALALINAAAEITRVYWPIVTSQIAAFVGHLEAIGIDLEPRKRQQLTRATPHETIVTSKGGAEMTSDVIEPAQEPEVADEAQPGEAVSGDEAAETAGNSSDI